MMADHRDAIVLSESIALALSAERDACVRVLEKRTAELAAMSPVEYLARGIDVDSLASFDLIGRLAKKGWRSLEYIEGKPGWRVNDDKGFERYVSRREVHEMLGLPDVVPPARNALEALGQALIAGMSPPPIGAAKPLSPLGKSTDGEGT